MNNAAARAAGLANTLLVVGYGAGTIGIAGLVVTTITRELDGTWSFWEGAGMFCVLGSIIIGLTAMIRGIAALLKLLATAAIHQVTATVAEQEPERFDVAG